jgi:nitrogen fixation/metabolism regulation signal transduction histidine kinase
MNYLDLLFSMIEERYGNDVVWTTLNDITDWVDAQQRAAPQGETRRVAAA